MGLDFIYLILFETSQHLSKDLLQEHMKMSIEGKWLKCSSKSVKSNNVIIAPLVVKQWTPKSLEILCWWKLQGLMFQKQIKPYSDQQFNQLSPALRTKILGYENLMKQNIEAMQFQLPSKYSPSSKYHVKKTLIEPNRICLVLAKTKST